MQCKRSFWTEEEDHLLSSLVSYNLQTKDRRGVDWKEIASYFPGREAEYCRKHWRLRHGNDSMNFNRGAWSAEEDARLKDFMNSSLKPDKNIWAAAARYIKTRKPDQCSKRWKDALDPNIVRTEWTKEEDAALLMAFARLGSQWSEIRSQYLPKRPNQDLRNRMDHLSRLTKKNLSKRKMSKTRPWKEEYRNTSIATFHEMQVGLSESDFSTNIEDSYGNFTMSSGNQLISPCKMPPHVDTRDISCSPSSSSSMASVSPLQYFPSSNLKDESLLCCGIPLAHTDAGQQSMAGAYVHEQGIHQLDHLSFPFKPATSSPHSHCKGSSQTSSPDLPFNDANYAESLGRDSASSPFSFPFPMEFSEQMEQAENDAGPYLDAMLVMPYQTNAEVSFALSTSYWQSVQRLTSKKEISTPSFPGAPFASSLI